MEVEFTRVMQGREVLVSRIKVRDDGSYVTLKGQDISDMIDSALIVIGDDEYTVDDDLDFFKRLPMQFRTPYLMATVYSDDGTKMAPAFNDDKGYTLVPVDRSLGDAFGR